MDVSESILVDRVKQSLSRHNIIPALDDETILALTNEVLEHHQSIIVRQEWLTGCSIERKVNTGAGKENGDSILMSFLKYMEGKETVHVEDGQEGMRYVVIPSLGKFTLSFSEPLFILSGLVVSYEARQTITLFLTEWLQQQCNVRPNQPWVLLEE